jgi:hypothetical protein
MEDLFKVAFAIAIMTGFPMLMYAGFIGIRVLQRRLERSGLPSGEVQHELDELRSRLAELEERVDFSERMLTQDKQVPQIRDHQ